MNELQKNGETRRAIERAVADGIAFQFGPHPREGSHRLDEARTVLDMLAEQGFEVRLVSEGPSPEEKAIDIDAAMAVYERAVRDMTNRPAREWVADIVRAGAAPEEKALREALEVAEETLAGIATMLAMATQMSTEYDELKQSLRDADPSAPQAGSDEKRETREDRETILADEVVSGRLAGRIRTGADLADPPPQKQPCPKCGGTRVRDFPAGFPPRDPVCPACSGTGEEGDGT